jgi:hypothetical protein
VNSIDDVNINYVAQPNRQCTLLSPTLLTAYQRQIYGCPQGRKKPDSYLNLSVILLELYFVILLGLLPCNRLESDPLEYIKEGRVLRSADRQPKAQQSTTPSAGRNIPNYPTEHSVLRYFGGPPEPI